jgi:pilus assembly protein TadC
VILPVVLLGAAAAVALLRPTSGRRLRRLTSRDQPVSPSSFAKVSSPQALCVAVGLVAWWLVGGVAGLVVGAVIAAAGPRLLGRLDDTAEKEAGALARQLPLALDLLGACLAGGATLGNALTSVAAAVGGPCEQRMQRVAAALAVGTPAEEAFRELGSTGAAGSAARALCRASDGGTPVAAAVTRVAAEARRAAAVEARKRAKRAGVLAVGPLGACFLPAFLVLGVMPTVTGLATPLLRSF